MNKISLLTEVLTGFSQHYKALWNEKVSEPANRKRAEELHPSSFPYCGLRHAWEWLQEGEDPEHQEMGASMAYYTGVGTVVHSMLQRFIGKVHPKTHDVKGYVIGDWKCLNKKCGKTYSFTHMPWCKKCKHETLYEELGIKFGRRTHGHTDCLYCIEVANKKSGKVRKFYFIVDYKTSSVEAIQAHNRFGNRFPYTSNREQIRAYAIYLEELYDIEISGWILCYVARDNPQKHFALVGDVLDDDDKEELRKLVHKSDKVFHYVRNRIAVDTVEEDVVPVLVKHKLCKNRKYYEERVADKFDPCPLAENGSCFTDPTPRLLRAIRAHNKRER